VARLRGKTVAEILPSRQQAEDVPVEAS
jgi:hypothetical protein